MKKLTLLSIVSVLVLSACEKEEFTCGTIEHKIVECEKEEYKAIHGDWEWIETKSQSTGIIETSFITEQNRNISFDITTLTYTRLYNDSTITKKFEINQRNSNNKGKLESFIDFPFPEQLLDSNIIICFFPMPEYYEVKCDKLYIYENRPDGRVTIYERR